VLDLMEGLSSGAYRLSPLVTVEIFQAAREGDAAAQQVLRWAGEELGQLAAAVIRQIGMQGEAVEVVQSGSVFLGGELVSEPMREVIWQHAPRAQIVRLEAPPVVGPVLLAMQAAGVDGYPVRGTLIQSAREMVG